MSECVASSVHHHSGVYRPSTVAPVGSTPRDGDRTPRKRGRRRAGPRPTATPGTRRGADSRERKIEPQLNLSSHGDVSDVRRPFATVDEGRADARAGPGVCDGALLSAVSMWL
jgi:hypothetical protein